MAEEPGAEKREYTSKLWHRSDFPFNTPTVSQEDGKLQLQQLTSSLTFPCGAPEVWKDLCRVRPVKGESVQQKFWKIALQPPSPLPFPLAACHPFLFGSVHSGVGAHSHRDRSCSLFTYNFICCSYFHRKLQINPSLQCKDGFQA